jgi:hypothetical protein
MEKKKGIWGVKILEKEKKIVWPHIGDWHFDMEVHLSL